MVKILISFAAQAFGIISALVLSNLLTYEVILTNGEQWAPTLQLVLTIAISMITIPLSNKVGTMFKWAWKMFLILILVFVVMGIVLPLVL